MSTNDSSKGVAQGCASALPSLAQATFAMPMRLPEDHWYPVLDSRELGRKPLPSERLGQQLVFWRTADGRAHANLDRCPHLGAALSGGSVRHDRLICPFHGFEGHKRSFRAVSGVFPS
jgi:phenylpropionate dioxygenase-like ring-hydroxylating dioxygenase large terminal subunit